MQGKNLIFLIEGKLSNSPACPRAGTPFAHAS